jgi:hypothetical protein
MEVAMSFKVGDKVRLLAGNGYGHAEGTLGVITVVMAEDVAKVSMNDGYPPIYLYDHEFEVVRDDDDTIQSVMDVVNVEPLSTGAFRQIIEMLNGAVESALDDMNFDKAIEYAVMMRECERMMKDE